MLQIENSVYSFYFRRLVPSSGVASSGGGSPADLGGSDSVDRVSN